MISAIRSTSKQNSKGTGVEEHRKFEVYGLCAEDSSSGIADISDLEFDLRVLSSETDARVLRNEESQGKEKSRAFEMESSDVCGKMGEESQRVSGESSNHDSGKSIRRRGSYGMENSVGRGDAKLDSYSSFLHEFDDVVSSENDEDVALADISRHGFHVGDMVWGKVKSHPWWPGHIFNEAFASDSVRRTKREEHILVAFFGDSSYGWFHPAELIPFDQNFAEKSQQTNARNFVKAVEEAVDEVCRRHALGVVCKCRNSSNFMPLSVSGYFAVDVPDYEMGGVYSLYQIRKAREAFLPAATLSFVKQLALAPGDFQQDDIDFMKHKAMALAYRKAVYEEFDETYAQAFGVQPGQLFHDRSSLVGQLVKQSPRAPLSGPMVVAEFLDGEKGSRKPMKDKVQAKGDGYELKRRRDEPALHAPTLPKASSSAAPVLHWNASSSAIGISSQRSRPSPSLAPFRQDQMPCLTDEPAAHAKSVPISSHTGFDSVPVPRAIAASDGKPGSDKGKGIIFHEKQEAGLDAGQESSGIGSSESAREEENSRSSLDGGVLEGKPYSPARALPMKPDFVDGRFDASVAERNAGRDLSELDLRQLLADLRRLAVDPFYGEERNARANVLQVFLRFRSVVFEKSLNFSPSSPPTESACASVPKPASPTGIGDVPVGDQEPRPAKRARYISRPEDPTKSGRKRVPSDRQEELMSKKLKKIERLKSITGDKKPQPQRSVEVSQTQEKDSLPVTVGPKQTKPAPQAAETEPTMLVMKFPPNSSLPSVAELKARFARFGSIEQSAIRVFWHTSTCRVAFRHKLDAQAAYKHVIGNNSLFGNANVKCIVREKAPPLDSIKPELLAGIDLSSMQSPRSPVSSFMEHHHQSTIQPKSILKKPFRDGGKLGSGGSNGSRGTSRVKFMLSEDETVKEERSVMDDNRNVNASFAHAAATYTSYSSSSSSSPTSLDVDNNSKIIPTVSAPPPPSILRPPSLLADASENESRTNNPSSGAPQADFSWRMLTLLSRCNEVVTAIAGVNGRPPYHPL